PEALVYYRIHGGNAGSRSWIDYSSPEALAASCQKLLKNEVAQILELKKISRYRRGEGLADVAGNRALATMFRTARLRAALVLAVSRKPKSRWICPALKAARDNTLRRLALRTLATGFGPSAVSPYRTVPQQRVDGRRARRWVRVRACPWLGRRSMSEAAPRQ